MTVTRRFTERRPTARDIAGEIDAIGGEFNAFTGKEYTGYYVKCAAEHRDTALDVLVDMIRHSRFDPEEIEREKGVIVEEMNMYIDTPRDYVDSVYDELLYGDQPLGWVGSWTSQGTSNGMLVSNRTEITAVFCLFEKVILEGECYPLARHKLSGRRQRQRQGLRCRRASADRPPCVNSVSSSVQGCQQSCCRTCKQDRVIDFAPPIGDAQHTS